MPSQNARVWSTRRKLLGNLVPLSLGLLCGWFVFSRLPRAPLEPPGNPYAPPPLPTWMMPALWGGLSFVVVGWLATNLLSQLGNEPMRRELAKRLKPGPTAWFVGFARPSYTGLLDPHEDVGFVEWTPETLLFRGEAHRLDFDRTDVKSVRFRPSMHTALGLGGWVSVEGEMGGKPIRLLIEPRVAATLWGNLLAGRRLRKLLAAWLKGP